MKKNNIVFGVNYWTLLCSAERLFVDDSFFLSLAQEEVRRVVADEEMKKQGKGKKTATRRGSEMLQGPGHMVGPCGEGSALPLSYVYPFGNRECKAKD